MVNFIKAWLSRCDTPEDFGVVDSRGEPGDADDRRATTEPKKEKVYARDTLPDSYPEDWDFNKRFPKPNRDDYPTYAEYNARYMHHSDLESERRSRQLTARRKEAEAELVEVKAQDDANRLAAHSFVPDIKVVRYAAGDFLIFDGKEMPRAFITDIEVVSPGEEPKLNIDFNLYGPVVFITYPNAKIKITLSSRKEFFFLCNRWVVDQLHAALLNAWKHGVATEEAHG